MSGAPDPARLPSLDPGLRMAYNALASPGMFGRPRTPFALCRPVLP